ncbi:hypothetical protein BH09BAC1_BH09BAC1_07010 [soil metagenome]
MKPKALACLLALTILSIGAQAQDYQFTQFFNSPLTLNPALTGKVNGTFRAAVNYRNQWFNPAEKPFITYSGSFDAPIMIGKDALGLGVVIVNDQTNNGVYNNTVIMGSAAYHKALDKKGKHSLSLGVQAGYYQRRLDRNDLRFFNQFQDGNFNPSLPSNEGNIATSDGNFDMQVGLLGFNQLSKRVSVYYGGSMFHILQPKEHLLGAGEYELKRRYMAHAGSEIAIGKVVRLMPSLIYLNQAKESALNLGLSVGFDMTQGVYLHTGAYYRVVDKLTGKFGASDAAIFYAAFEYKVARLGFSYDATLSSLKNTPKPTGAFEVSLVIMGPPRPVDNKSLLFCPRF